MVVTAGCWAGAAVKKRRISLCFLAKSKNLAVLVFALLLSAFLFAFANFLFLFFVFSAWSCRDCLSASVPVRNLCCTSLSCVASVFGTAGSTHCALKVKQLSGCFGAPVLASFNSLRRAFFSAVASTHCSAFAASFSPRTRNFQLSLSCAIATSSSQLTPGSISISMSPGCLYAWVCLMAFFIRRSSFTSFLPSGVFFHRSSGKRRMCPSHCSLLARIQSRRLNVVECGDAS